MTEATFPRDFYDLCYHRSDLKYVGFGDGTDRTKQQVADVQKSREHLDHLSKEIRRILEKRDALISCQHFLACALSGRMGDFTRRIGLPTATALPRRSDTKDEAIELQSRLDSTKRENFSENVLIQSLAQLGHAVRLRFREKRDPLCSESPDLLYRVHYLDSHTFYDKDVGFCCPRWLRQRIFSEPSTEDFRNHCDGKEQSFQSPYISMTESPCRVLCLGQGKGYAEVFLIDFERLRATKIKAESTTYIAKRLNIQYKGSGDNRVHFITDSHWVAQYWIPADCILKKVSFCQFQKICNNKRICSGMETPPNPLSSHAIQCNS